MKHFLVLSEAKVTEARASVAQENLELEDLEVFFFTVTHLFFAVNICNRPRSLLRASCSTVWVAMRP